MAAGRRDRIVVSITEMTLSDIDWPGTMGLAVLPEPQEYEIEVYSGMSPSNIGMSSVVVQGVPSSTIVSAFGGVVAVAGTSSRKTL